MTKTINYMAPCLSAAAIGGVIALAPLGSAATAVLAVPHNKVITTAAPSPSGGRPPGAGGD
jgi:hypothetical protein